MIDTTRIPRRRDLVGYTDRPSAAPGEAIEFMVSTEFDSYDVQLVQLIHGDTNPTGPGPKEIEVPSSIDRSLPGSAQETYPGSCIVVPPGGALDDVSSFTVTFWFLSTTPELADPQGLIARWSPDTGGLAVLLDDGRVAFWLGDAAEPARLTSQHPIRPGRWYFVAASYDATSGSARLEVRADPTWAGADATSEATAHTVPTAGGDSTPLLIGALTSRPGQSGRTATGGHFNGRIECPTVVGGALTVTQTEKVRAGDAVDTAVVAQWDFAADHAADEIPDRSGNGLHGTAVNCPTRALVGHAWDRKAFGPAQGPEQYSAIEFHADDIADVGWDVSFRFEVPDDMPTGIYAARLRAGETTDHVPFVVTPPLGQPTADVCLLWPTMTYLAYANESTIHTSGEADYSSLTNVEISPDPYDLHSWDHPEFGYSTYDLHADGTGNRYSSWRRPILNMRPGHRFWVTNAPRHFAADLYIVDWLREKGHAHDVVTDHDLHADGVDRLSPYKVVVTGSHPEYWTAPMLDALHAYLDGGGSLMYLGGNGFYWVTGVHPHHPHIAEIRRGYSAGRVWTAHPAERHLSTTGELGDLWRFRGRPPQALTGVGFAAQGWDVESPGYDRLPDSYTEEAAFIFDGIDDDVIGDFGLVLNSAAAEEIDRCDDALGTPPNALRLATTEGRHSAYFLIAHEELGVTIPTIDGTNNPNVRADIVYFDHPGGGAVFSVGSMTFVSALSHDGYDNNVSTVVGNVLRRFMS